MTGRELNGLLDAIDLFRLKPHEELQYASVASLRNFLSEL